MRRQLRERAIEDHFRQSTKLITTRCSGIATIEKRTDMYVSTLRSHIEAMGGKLEVVARFPEGTVRISNLAEPGGKDGA